MKPRLGSLRPPSLWPSDASASLVNDYEENYQVGSCRRAVFFRYLISHFFYNQKKYEVFKPLVEELLSCESPPDKYMLWVWEAGNLFEDHVIELAKKAGVWIASQVQVVIPEFNIVGKLDLIVMDPTKPAKNLIAEEVKSIYGHNANSILGTPGMIARKQLGTPRDSNLLQAALYDWHFKKSIPDLNKTRLFYGARDTGRYAEFDVITDETNDDAPIVYQGVAPYITGAIRTKISINNVLANYSYIQNYFDDYPSSKDIPPRDYDKQYSEKKIQLLNERGELSKTNTEAWEKIQARLAENIQRETEGKAPKKELKGLEIGDFKCQTCSFRTYCYDNHDNPRR